MRNLEKTEQKIADRGYSLYELSTREVRCASLCFEKKIGIFIDPSKFENSIEKRTALEHECFHADNNLFYGFEDTLRKRKRQEFKANYKMALELMPFEEVKCLIDNGYTMDELSDHFELSEDFIKEALRIYATKGLKL